MKKFLAIITAIFMLIPLSAFEWGGLVTEDAKYQNNNETTQIKQSNNVSLWVNLPITNDASWYFAGQTSLKYYFDYNFNGDSQFLPVADLELAKLAGVTSINNSIISIASGRYSTSDLTGKVFNQVNDGISVKVSTAATEYSGYIGYTGLINSMNVTMLGENRIAHETVSGIYSSSHAYLPVLLAVEVPSLFLNQALNVQASAFIDLETTQYNRYYLAAGLTGPIVSPVYYSLLGTLESSDFTQFSVYGSLSLQAFISSFMVKIFGEYASGNQFGLSPFTTFTSCTAYSSIISPELSGVILTGADFVYSIGNIYSSLSGKFVLAYPEEEIIVKGVNANINLIWNIFSDLKTGVNCNYYYDLETSGELNNMSVALNISLSF